ncbi:MAG: hypothetical protein ACQEP8_00815 [Chlamydiota bacterium]
MPVDKKTSRHQFGTIAGVFNPSILTILGVIIFMRANYVLGHGGIFQTTYILLISEGIILATAFSIAAISTNLKVKTGGAYYLISRVLGPEFGGAIGLTLFCSVGLSVSFYILGMTEALLASFPFLTPYFQQVNFGLLALIFGIVFVGAGWTLKTQYLVLGVLFSAIIAFFAGIIPLFSLETFKDNLAPLRASSSTITPLSFWALFAIYFPAVTGINSGLNMSGDLKNPQKSIPRGIVGAIIVGFIVYFGQLIVAGGAFSRLQLINHPYDILKDNALWGMNWLVAAGILAATFSSALASMAGAPRILQAVARDFMIKPLRPFAKGTLNGDEPRYAVLLTLFLNIFIFWWVGKESGGQGLNIVAAIITMFFLFSYGIINLSAFIEAVGANPSFRPTFKFYHWVTTLLGGLGCLAAAFLINAYVALIAIFAVALLMVYMSRIKIVKPFADARRGFLYTQLRRILLRLATTEEDQRNWRPTPIVFCGNPYNRESLVVYSSWLVAQKGIIFLASIIEGKFYNHGGRRNTVIKQMLAFCKEKDINAFPVAVVADNIPQGISLLLQSTGVGALHPNIAIFGWSSDEETLQSYMKQLRMARSLNMNVVIINPKELIELQGRFVKRVDIWWRGRRNGSLMVLLGHLMTLNPGWHNAELRVMRLIENEEGRQPAVEALEKLLEYERINAKAQVIVSQEPFRKVFQRTSSDASAVIIGFEFPDDDENSYHWHSKNSMMMDSMPTTIMVSAAK